MKKNLLLILFIGTAAMIYIMMRTGAPLNTATTQHGIVDLELAYDKAHVDIVLSAWQPDNKIDAAIINTYWDFLFILFYAFFLFTVCIILAGKFFAGSWQFNGANFFGKAILFAGMLDAGENVEMLQSLNGHSSETLAIVTASCSAIKWALVLLTILYILIALVLKRQTPRSA